jgi:Lipoprotein LpqB beta-propeller domain/Sporulation and spore germination
VLCTSAALVASACTAVPDSGPVHAGQQAAPAAGPHVQVEARRPIRGSAPDQIVSGFRFANSDTSEALGVAKAYLVDGATWQPQGVTVVADSGSSPVDTTVGDTTIVTTADTQVGSIAADGTYQPSPGHQISYSYQLIKDAKEGDEWRITNAPANLVLTVSQIESSYQMGYVYFLRPDEQMLVPVQVFLPVSRDKFAESLLTTLLHGPPDWLKPAVTTAIPGSVTAPGPTQSNNVTTVDLSQRVATLSLSQRNAIAAQISYTLANPATQLQDFGDLKILAGEQPLISDPRLAVQTADDWTSFDPDALRTEFYYSDLDHLTRDHTGQLVAGETGSLGITNLLAPVLAPRAPGTGTGDLIAGVVQQATGTEALYAGPLLAPKKLLSGSAFTTPSWDSLGNLWTVQQDSSTSVPKVRIAPSGKATLPGTVTAPELANKVIEELKVSRDGTRVAVLAQSTNVSQVLVGVVAKDGTTIEHFYPVAPSLTSVTDFAWASSTTLDILSTSPTSNEAGTSSHLWSVDVDGWSPSLKEQGVLPTAESVAAAPHELVVIGTSGNEIDVYQNNQWVFVGTGTSPHYPG